MKLLLAVVLLASAAAAQIEATDPGTGILIAGRVLYRGQLVAAGMPRADAVRTLGQAKTIMKPRATSSAKLLAESAAAFGAVQHVEMQARMRAVRDGQPIPEPDETYQHIGPAWEQLVVARCGACWTELLAVPLGKGETLRLILIGPTRDQLAVAAVLLDKARNGVKTGRLIIYQGDHAVRLTQDPGVFKVEELDLGTGAPKQ